MTFLAFIFYPKSPPRSLPYPLLYHLVRNHQQRQPTLKQKTTRLNRQAAYAGLGINAPPKLMAFTPCNPRLRHACMLVGPQEDH